MASAAPKTLEELAERGGTSLAELADFSTEDAEELMKELGINVTARVRLKKLHREYIAQLQESQRAESSRAKFDSFLSRVGGADALAGLEKVPLSGLDDALGFIKGPGAPSRDALRDGAAAAYAKADALLADGPDPHGLGREEIAAVNIYTQQVLYRALNAAMRGEVRSNVKVYWGYIRLLQHALFKLPKVSGSQAIFRGVKGPSPDITLAQLKAMIATGEHFLWWGFSSTSTSLEAVNAFLGDAKRVIFTIDGGSSARDVKRYSDYVQEDELLMPCGSAFLVNTASSPAENLLLVSIQQTDDFLIQGVIEEGEPLVGGAAEQPPHEQPPPQDEQVPPHLVQQAEPEPDAEPQAVAEAEPHPVGDPLAVRSPCTKEERGRQTESKSVHPLQLSKQIHYLPAAALEIVYLDRMMLTTENARCLLAHAAVCAGIAGRVGRDERQGAAGTGWSGRVLG